MGCESQVTRSVFGVLYSKILCWHVACTCIFLGGEGHCEINIQLNCMLARNLWQIYHFLNIRTLTWCLGLGVWNLQYRNIYLIIYSVYPQLQCFLKVLFHAFKPQCHVRILTYSKMAYCTYMYLFTNIFMCIFQMFSCRPGRNKHQKSSSR